MAGKTTPSAPDPKAGRNPGYAEPQPRDKGDAHQAPKPRPDREEGGPEHETDPQP